MSLTRRLWAVEHFRVLPTDPRLREMSSEGLAILHQHWLRTMPEDSVKKRYWEKRAEEMDDDDDDLRQQLSDIGYDGAAIEEIVKETRSGRV